MTMTAKTTTTCVAAFSATPLARHHCIQTPPSCRATRNFSPGRSSIPSPFALRSPRTSPLVPASVAAFSKKASIHQDDEGNCVFGKKEYWDAIYGGEEGGDVASSVAAADRRPSDSYSWYCGWSELAPFWSMIVPDRTSRVVIAGVGNDPTPVEMYDAGWTSMTAYDYSQTGVDRARELMFADNAADDDGTTPSRRAAEVITADATRLPMGEASVDATLDKGTLDAVYIAGKGGFRDAAREMGRVTAAGGRVVTISRVIDPDVLLGEFDTPLWENVHDGGLAFAEDGEATIDLGAELYSWRRTDVPFDNGDIS